MRPTPAMEKRCIWKRPSNQIVSAAPVFSGPAEAPMLIAGLMSRIRNSDLLLRRLDGPRVDINYLRPFAFGRKTGCAHQLGDGFDRWRIGARETARITLGEE